MLLFICNAGLKISEFVLYFWTKISEHETDGYDACIDARRHYLVNYNIVVGIGSSSQ